MKKTIIFGWILVMIMVVSLVTAFVPLVPSGGDKVIAEEDVNLPRTLKVINGKIEGAPTDAAHSFVGKSISDTSFAREDFVPERVQAAIGGSYSCVRDGSAYSSSRPYKGSADWPNFQPGASCAIGDFIAYYSENRYGSEPSYIFGELWKKTADWDKPLFSRYSTTQDDLPYLVKYACYDCDIDSDDDFEKGCLTQDESACVGYNDNLCPCTGSDKNACDNWYGVETACRLEVTEEIERHVKVCNGDDLIWFSSTGRDTGITAEYCDDGCWPGANQCDEDTGGGNDGDPNGVIEITNLHLSGGTYTPGQQLSFSVSVKNTKDESEIADIEVGIYCGPLKAHAGLADLGYYTRAASVDDYDQPCVAGEESFVQRKKLTLSSEESKSVSTFTLTVPENGDYGKTDIPNWASASDPICYIKADTFDKCWSETGDSTSPGYEDTNTAWQVPFNVNTGEIIDPNDIVCCELDKTQNEAMEEYIEAVGDVKAASKLISFGNTATNKITNFMNTAWNILTLGSGGNLFDLFSFSRTEAGVGGLGDLLDNIPAEQADANLKMLTTEDICTKEAGTVVDVTEAVCTESIHDYAEAFKEVVQEQWIDNPDTCSGDSDCPTWAPQCGSDNTCKITNLCSAGDSCVQDEMCKSGDLVLVKNRCVDGCYVPTGESCPAGSINPCDSLATISECIAAWFNRQEPNGEEATLEESEDDTSEWCIKRGLIFEFCYPKKDGIFLDDLDQINQLTVWEEGSKGYLKDPENPLCLVGYGDVQCVEGAECLAAINDDRDKYKENKRVYDELKDIVRSNNAQFNDAVKWVSPLNLIGKGFAWIFDIESETEKTIEQFGVCAWEERGVVDRAKAWLADALGLQGDSLTYTFWGIVGVAGFLLVMLLKPPKPRRF